MELDGNFDLVRIVVSWLNLQTDFSYVDISLNCLPNFRICNEFSIKDCRGVTHPAYNL